MSWIYTKLTSETDTMVTKRQIFTCVGVVVTCFVIVQCYLHFKMPRIHPIDKARHQSSAYLMIKDFVGHCDDTGVHCILVDSWILKELVHETLEDARNNFSPCKHFCKNHIYTFAIRDSDFYTFQRSLLPILKKSGYDIQVASHALHDIPTHIHLRYHENHALHIVILHNRDGWWWYGPDTEDVFNLDFTKSEGALDGFDYDFKVPIDGIEVYMPHYPSRFLDMHGQSYFMPCNRSKASSFDDRYSKDFSQNATDYRANAAKAISLVRSRLDAYNIPFWLHNGTLLGWFQRCDNIPYNDIDVGIYISDHTEDLLANLRGSFLMLEQRFGYVKDSLQYAFDMGKFRIVMTFFYEDEVTGRMWYGGTDFKTRKKYKYLMDKFTLCWTSIGGVKVRMPCKVEQYLNAIYGERMLMPVKDWDWRMSPSNVLPNGKWREDEVDDVVQLWDKKGKRLNSDSTKIEL